jgi:hypothetical protein
VHYVFIPDHYIGIVIANTTLLYKWKEVKYTYVLGILPLLSLVSSHYVIKQSMISKMFGGKASGFYIDFSVN